MKNDLEYVRLGDLTEIKTGKLDANAANAEGEFPFFTCAVTPLRISTYSYDCECVLVAGNGDLNVKYYNGKFDAYQRTYIIESKSPRLYMPFLYHFMDNYIEVLRRQAIGGVIKYIKLENLTNIKIPLPNIEKQKEITRRLGTVSTLIEKNKEKLRKFDDLIKLQFDEMFGKGDFMVAALEDVLSYEQPAKYIVKNVHYSNKFTTPVLTAGKTFILGYTNDNSGIYPGKKDPVIIFDDFTTDSRYVDFDFKVKSSAIKLLHLKNKEEQMIYYYYAIKNIKFKPENHQRFWISKFSKFQVKQPPIDMQNQFAAFVKQIEKLKSAIKKSIEKLELCHQSLLQECFE